MILPGFVFVIEGTDCINNKQGLDIIRDYQKEALICIESISSNYRISNKIVLICPSFNPPDSDFIQEISKYEQVEYIYDPQEESKEYTCGFDLKVLGLKLFQDKYQKRFNINRIIHFDLDMSFVKDIPEYFYEMVISNRTYIGRYTNSEKVNDLIKYDSSNPFDTGLIITDKSNNFIDKWYYELINIKQKGCTVFKNKLNGPITEEDKDAYEEYIVHKMFILNDIDIEPVTNYQCGEFYTIDDFTTDSVNNIIFLHEHYYSELEYCKIKNRIKYSKLKDRSNV